MNQTICKVSFKNYYLSINVAMLHLLCAKIVEKQESVQIVIFLMSYINIQINIKVFYYVIYVIQEKVL